MSGISRAASAWPGAARLMTEVPWETVWNARQPGRYVFKEFGARADFGSRKLSAISPQRCDKKNGQPAATVAQASRGPGLGRHPEFV